MKFCRDCVHYKKKIGSLPICAAISFSSKPDVLRGSVKTHYEACLNMRHKTSHCGTEAKLFKPRKKSWKNILENDFWWNFIFGMVCSCFGIFVGLWYT